MYRNGFCNSAAEEAEWDVCNLTEVSGLDMSRINSPLSLEVFIYLSVGMTVIAKKTREKKKGGISVCLLKLDQHAEQMKIFMAGKPENTRRREPAAQ